MKRDEAPSSAWGEVGFACAVLQLAAWVALLGWSGGWALALLTRNEAVLVLAVIVFALNVPAVFISRRFENDARALWGLGLSSVPLLWALSGLVCRLAAGE